MKRLARLFTELESTTSTTAKVDALARYFADVSDPDKVWAIAMFAHRRPPRTVPYRLLGIWAAEMAGLPEWLFEESYHVVGDYAETIALLIPEKTVVPAPDQTLTDYMHLILNLKRLSVEEKRTVVTAAWCSLGRHERFIFNKLITGGLRIGVSQRLMIRALAKHSGVEENILTARLMGKWDPASTKYRDLVLADQVSDAHSRPYPFFLAHPLDKDPETLGDPGEWLVERKWDGIRGQLICRAGQLFIWTRGEELVTEKYPELHPLSTLLPHGTVIDCELVAYRDGRPLPFQDLQKRIGRNSIPRKMLDEIPVRALIYDLIEWEGRDIRHLPQSERRAMLESLHDKFNTNHLLILSELVDEPTWEAYNHQRLDAGVYACEGLMLKHRDAVYDVGRKRGSWWKWKTDPYAIDCVMIYAQRGQGRRAGFYTDFTFAVRDGDQLVPFAKAYSGLTDAEFEEITQWVSQNTIERFGPVSVVPAVHVFELHFEGIGYSARHKSGIAVRFPRIHRWRKDKRAEEINHIEDLRKLINP